MLSPFFISLNARPIMKRFLSHPTNNYVDAQQQKTAQDFCSATMMDRHSLLFLYQ
jgi:hypothetical protein